MSSINAGMRDKLHEVEVNVVKFYEDADFSYAKRLCESSEFDWDLVYRKKSTIVSILKTSSEFDMIRAQSEYEFSADLLYDVLQDGEFRSQWDRHMLETVDIGFLNPNQDLCYYAMGALSPIKSRDFVLQRAWLDMGDEKILCSHSVCHKDYPITKTHVRGIVYLTVYFVKALSQNTCRLTYVTHSDPKGKLPSWFINKLTKNVAPRVFKQLQKACKEYSNWKSHNRPDYKPWRYPEQQLDFPRIDPQIMCKPTTQCQQTILDETKLAPEDVKSDED